MLAGLAELAGQKTTCDHPSAQKHNNLSGLANLGGLAWLAALVGLVQRHAKVSQIGIISVYSSQITCVTKNHSRYQADMQ